MTCLHFRIDRRTGICPDCGWQVPAVVAARVEIINKVADAAGVNPQAIAEAIQKTPDVRPAPVQSALGDDIREELAQMKAAMIRGLEQAAAPIIEQAPPEYGYQGIARDYAMNDVRTPSAAGTSTYVEKEDPNALRDGQSSLAADSATIVRAPEAVLSPEDTSAGREARVLSGMQSEDESEAEDGTGESAELVEPIYAAILGGAGVGKTFAAMQRAQRGDAILCATTGIAAINIGGCTINSLLGFKDTDDLRVNYEVGKLGAFLKRMVASGYYRIVCDEISMMDGNQLDILCLAIDEYNVWANDHGKRQLGMTLVGDFAQLPPVNAPFVFEREAWKRFEPNATMLTHVHRQADQDFIAGLNAVRKGDRRGAMDYFGGKIVQGEQQDYDGSTILASNAEVDRYNKLRMLALTTPVETFTAIRIGKQSSEWVKNIPDQLEMKAGALVMILANRRYPNSGEEIDAPMMYANGSLGHFVKKHSEDSAEVCLLTGESVHVQTVLREKMTPTGRAGSGEKKKARTVEDLRREAVAVSVAAAGPVILDENGNPIDQTPDARKQIEGSIAYMPLRVAYATTCHKSQGLSLDRVQIMFHSRFWATCGMLYVALSRARTPEGLRLVGTPAQFEARVNTDHKIARWL